MTSLIIRISSFGFLSSFVICHSSSRRGSPAKISGRSGGGLPAGRGSNNPRGPGNGKRKEGFRTRVKVGSTARPRRGERPAGSGQAQTLCGAEQASRAGLFEKRRI